jgi:hypothetical protein
MIVENDSSTLASFKVYNVLNGEIADTHPNFITQVYILLVSLKCVLIISHKRYFLTSMP